MLDFPDEGDTPALEDAAPVSDAARLAAALAALGARDQVIADQARRLRRLEGIAARLSAVTARLRLAEEAYETLRRARQAEATAEGARLADLEHRLVAAEARRLPAEETPSEAIARLEADLRAERRRNWVLGARGQPAAAELASLRESVAGLQERLAALEAELAAAHERAEHLAAREREAASRAEEAVRRHRAEIEEKDQLVAVLIERLRAAGGVQEGPDDFKEIVGIGPVIEDLLHRLGITTFEQLAVLSAAEIDAIAGRLGAFPERIIRDRWREQAAAIAARRLRLGPGLILR